MKRVSELLIRWYDNVKRELPWRDVKDPYLIWISEIILQQTRVAQGLDYYKRFIDRFPNISALANADEEEVLKYWQGLGYYSRARNLHFAAKTIENEHKGVFPREYAKVRSLKGVGDYTAAAICSFAFDLPHAVVDGNVYRVLSRLFDIDLPIDSSEGKRFFAQLAHEILPSVNADSHNQAIMEFGAMSCVPSNPDCSNCILNEQCLAYANNRVGLLPVKVKKTKVRKRYFNYFRIHFQSSIYLNKRIGSDIWQNLYEFPLIETGESVDLERLSVMDSFKELFQDVEEVKIRLVANDVVHILSHQRIIASFYDVSITNESVELARFTKVNEDEMEKYPISRLVEILHALK